MHSDLSKSVLRQLNSAVGWLNLGDWEEAKTEVEAIDSQFKSHPVILSLWVEIHKNAQDWNQMAEISECLTQSHPDDPGNWINCAYGLRRSQGLLRAEEVLEKAKALFPKEPTICFNLACYAAQLGKLPEAKELLDEAIQLEPRCRAMALKDPDLEALWPSIESVEEEE